MFTTIYAGSTSTGDHNVKDKVNNFLVACSFNKSEFMIQILCDYLAKIGNFALS
jgi:hypothetical protein